MRYTVIMYKDNTHNIIEHEKGLAIIVSDLKTEGAEHIYVGVSKSDCETFVEYIKSGEK